MLSQSTLTQSSASSIGPARPFSQGTRPPLAGSSSSVGPPRAQTEAGRARAGLSSFGGSGPGPSAFRGMRGGGAGLDEEAAASLSFDRMYEAMMKEEATFVGELERFLQLHEQSKLNKTRALHNLWESEIGDDIKDKIAKAVDAIPARQGQRNRHKLMQEYLDVSNKKSRGVFRDIVIEAEYDPLIAHHGTITYKPRSQNDPCKLELRKLEDRKGPAEKRPEYRKPNVGGPEPRLDSILYSSLESTPHGRTSKIVPRPDAKPYALANRVTHDHWNLPTGNDVLLKELPLGKRCFVPQSSIAGVLEQI